MARTPKSHTSFHRAPSPIFQGVLITPCRECNRTHRLLISSDDQQEVDLIMDHLVGGLRAAGGNPFGACVVSHYPSTDLSVRDWNRVEEIARQDPGEVPF
jgi:hypothetical protein